MKTLKHEFFDNIPDKIEDGVLYVSMKYCTAIHKCVCGCGNETVTRLSPNDWKLTFDGESITLYPSIGNWLFKCKSHYWIRNSKIIHATTWNDYEIERGRQNSREAKSEVSVKKSPKPDKPKKKSTRRKQN